MKHILLVFSSDVTCQDTARRCMQRVAQSVGYSTHCASTFVKIVTAGSDTEEVLDKSRSTDDWLSVEQTISVLTVNEKPEHAEGGRAGSVSSEMENLAKGLHDAADSLPYLGSCVDIMLCIGHPDAVVADSDSVIPVAGALRRLFDWHDGCAVVVKSRPKLSALEHHLARFAHCQVINSADKLHLNWPRWRGKVAVIDHIENKGHVFPACWLDSHDWDSLVQQKLLCARQTSADRHSDAGVSSQTAVFGRTVEVLQEVDLRTFPLCLLDSWSLHLRADEQESEILMKYIQDLDQTGLLARVRVFPDISKIPVCGNMNLSTASWKDRVISEVDSMQENEEEQVFDDWLFLYFLLLPSHSGSPLSSVVAQVLLSPHEINRSVLPIVEDRILAQKSVTEQSRNHCRREVVPCDELVLDQRDTLEMMLILLKENLQQMLSEYQDVSKGGHACERILDMGADIQGQIISAAFHECPSVQKSSQDRRAGCGVSWFTGPALDLSRCPERLAMQATETRKTLHSFASVDSLTTSSPLSAADVDKKKESADFDVHDVCEYFNHDGSLKEAAACPMKSVRLKGRGLCSVDRRSSHNLQWPESMLLKYHDIFYYNSEINWSLEKRYSKVRDRGYFQDTRSSFVSPVKKAQQMHSMLRRSASAQISVADSRPERPRRMSPRKASMADIFKQPVSHLCSPRKLSQDTLNSATPEFPLFSKSKSLGQLSSDLRAQSADLPKRSRESFSRNRAGDDPVPSVADQGHGKRSSTLSDSGTACKRDRKLPVLSFHDADSLCPVRRSPRRFSRPLRISSDSSVNVSIEEKPDLREGSFHEVRNASFEHQQVVKERSLGNKTSESASAKMKRSDRHKLKLQRIIDHVLREKGILDRDKIYPACSRNLFNVSMVLLKTLTTSQNLTEEMKTVVYGQVTQIINLEKRRCGMAL
ncbi:hypothetical protein BsWGS_15995 [Bradybaena similaris]